MGKEELTNEQRKLEESYESMDMYKKRNNAGGVDANRGHRVDIGNEIQARTTEEVGPMSYVDMDVVKAVHDAEEAFSREEITETEKDVRISEAHKLSKPGHRKQLYGNAREVVKDAQVRHLEKMKKGNDSVSPAPKPDDSPTPKKDDGDSEPHPTGLVVPNHAIEQYKLREEIKKLEEDIKELKEGMRRLREIIEDLQNRREKKDNDFEPKGEASDKDNPETSNNKEDKDQHVKDWEKHKLVADNNQEDKNEHVKSLRSHESAALNKFTLNSAEYCAKHTGLSYEKAEEALDKIRSMPKWKRVVLYTVIVSLAAVGVGVASSFAAPMLGVAAGSGLWSMVSTLPGLGLLGAKAVGGYLGYKAGRGVGDDIFGKQSFERAQASAGHENLHRRLQKGKLEGFKESLFERAMNKFKKKSTVAVEKEKPDWQRYADRSMRHAKLMPAVASIALTAGAGALYHNWDSILSLSSSQNAPVEIQTFPSQTSTLDTIPAGFEASQTPMIQHPLVPSPVGETGGGIDSVTSASVPQAIPGGSNISNIDTSQSVAPPVEELSSIVMDDGVRNISDGIEMFAKAHGVNPDLSSIGHLSNGESINLLTDVIRDQQRVALDLTANAQDSLIDSNLNFLKDPTAVNAMKERLSATVANSEAVNRAMTGLDTLHEAAKRASEITIHVGS